MNEPQHHELVQNTISKINKKEYLYLNHERQEKQDSIAKKIKKYK